MKSTQVFFLIGIFKAFCSHNSKEINLTTQQQTFLYPAINIYFTKVNKKENTFCSLEKKAEDGSTFMKRKLTSLVIFATLQYQEYSLIVLKLAVVLALACKWKLGRFDDDS